jgi:PAS domain S-box-containing protein
MHIPAVWRTVLNITDAAALVLDTDGMVVDATEAALRLLGCGSDEVRGAPWSEVAARLAPAPETAIAALGSVSDWPAAPVAIGAFRSAGPGAVGLEARKVRLDTEDGARGLVVLTCAGPDAEHGSDGRCPEGREHVRALLDGLADAVHIADLSGRFIEVNEAACRRLGYTRGEMLSMSLADILSPEYGSLLSSRIADLMTDGHRVFETAHVRKDGTRVPIEFSGRVIQYEGRPVLFSVARDISGRREMEAILGSRDFLRVLVDNLPVAVFVKTVADRRYTLWNHAAERISGTPAVYVLGRRDEDLLAPDLVARYRAAEDEALRSRTVVMVPDDVIGRRGHPPMVLESMRGVLLDDEGHPSALVGIAHDITEARAARDALRAANELLRSVLSGLDQAVLTVEPGSGTIEDVNETAVPLLGYSAEELRGMGVTDLLVDDAGGDCRRLREALDGHLTRTLVSRCRVRRKDGQVFAAEHSVGPICVGGGTAQRLVCVIRDVSERQKTESGERLAAVGQLAAGVAHEFNNILAGMMMRAETAELSRSEADFDRLVDQVLRGAMRGSEITRRLAAFSGPIRMATGAVHLCSVLDEALAQANGLLRDAGVTVRRLYQSGLPTINGDLHHLRQAVAGLISNACHAMADGGVLTVEARRSADGSGGLLVRVSDTGAGIPAEDLPHVFEPFFTTKGLLAGSDVPGVGLGLGVAHAIIQAHGGTLEVDSLPGRGTVVELRLPAAEVSDAAGPDACMGALLDA